MRAARGRGRPPAHSRRVRMGTKKQITAMSAQATICMWLCQFTPTFISAYVRLLLDWPLFTPLSRFSLSLSPLSTSISSPLLSSHHLVCHGSRIWSALWGNSLWIYKSTVIENNTTGLYIYIKNRGRPFRYEKKDLKGKKTREKNTTVITSKITVYRLQFW